MPRPSRPAPPLQDRRPGRRAGAERREIRGALLNAARALFTTRDFAAVSVRQIAARAGVTPAMIHYYFGDKGGLYAELLAESIGVVLARIEAHPATTTLEEFLELYIRTIAANPWLPNLIVREVLYGAGEFRATFLRRFARRAVKALPALVRGSGSRRDLDPRFTVLSLVGMAVFPFIARPVVERILERNLDAGFVEEWIAHTRVLFREGARRA
jgi:AcrR family transcriptional regulator